MYAFQAGIKNVCLVTYFLHTFFIGSVALAQSQVITGPTQFIFLAA
jgi:hypothetical protein